MTTKLMIFDSNPLELIGLRQLFSIDEIDLRAETTKNEEKIRNIIGEWKPNVVMFDFLSYENAIDQITVEIKKDSEKTKILWLLLEDDEAVKYDAISAGADGCVMKSSFDDIKEAVEVVNNGDVFFSRRLLAKFAHDACMIVDHLGRRVFRLTEREKSVLQLIRLGATNEEISKELYISVETVKAHVRKIRDTLGVLNRRQMICGLRPAKQSKVGASSPSS